MEFIRHIRAQFAQLSIIEIMGDYYPASLFSRQEVSVVVEAGGFGPSGVNVMAQFDPSSEEEVVVVEPCDFLFVSVPPNLISCKL